MKREEWNELFLRTFSEYEMNQNNRVGIIGQIGTKGKTFTASSGKQYYESYISTRRNSNIVDRVPIIISMPKALQIAESATMKIIGRLCSYWENGQTKFFVWVDEIVKCNEVSFNMIYIRGKICKSPLYEVSREHRKTTIIVEEKNLIQISCFSRGDKARYVFDNFSGDQEVEIMGKILQMQGNKKSHAYGILIENIEKLKVQ